LRLSSPGGRLFQLLPAEESSASASAVLSKLRLRDRVQAVILAYESGMITPGQTD
jgi:hypothetical protein